MIDDAPTKGRYYYRMVISPDPRREDRYKDLDLRNLIIATMSAIPGNLLTYCK